MKPVKLYTTDWCAYCTRAKQLLKKRGIPFEEINVEGDHEKRAWLVQATGQRTVPQIFIGDDAIGGYTELAGLDRDGSLSDRLAD